MTGSFTIKELAPAEIINAASGLADILVDSVASGASVGFMAGFTRAEGQAFWQKIADQAAQDGRGVFVAIDDATGTLIGTVQIIPAAMPNQPHRADIAKMLVLSTERRRGIANALMQAAEEKAQQQGWTVLTLDTASTAAEKLYEKRGWVRVGTVPDYALMPNGSFCDTVFYYKAL